VVDEKPPQARIYGVETWNLARVGFTGFEIRESDGEGSATAAVLPDIATCADCLSDIRDPANRRYRYPFTNCTNCGPRYSIILRLPYDRINTTMAQFEMCPRCRAEYEDPLDRRFHAQPNCCVECGPQLELLRDGVSIATGDTALKGLIVALNNGQIAAVKGLGGFHLMTNATNDAAVMELRKRKHREGKPLAVMFRNLTAIQDVCEVADYEAIALTSAECPIVLLRTRAETALSAHLAPGSPQMGCLLPYTPLHHLLMAALPFPVVATSGNLSDEPIAIHNEEAMVRLACIADVMLVHNRPIRRQVDDSLVRPMGTQTVVMRRARGYAPLPITPEGMESAVLALGAHQKVAIAVGWPGGRSLSQHIGDLDTPESVAAFLRVAEGLPDLLGATVETVACDAHPDYTSTQMAHRWNLPVVQVPHHLAHVLACITENDLSGPVLGVAWDGTGYGEDGTIWGGEFLLVDDHRYRRVGHLRSFPLPGGDLASRDGRRCAAGLAMALDDADAQNVTRDLFTESDWRLVAAAAKRPALAPRTTSAGRLFDGIAALLGIAETSRFEGEAAMRLEWATLDEPKTAPPRLGVTTDAVGRLVVDWEPAVRAAISGRLNESSRREGATGFHAALAGSIVEVARRVDAGQVVLTGGCFQNRRLVALTTEALRAAGFRVACHQQVPPNDGGIALGQLEFVRRKRQPGGFIAFGTETP